MYSSWIDRPMSIGTAKVSVTVKTESAVSSR